MELNELPPKDGPQRAFCAACEGPLDLVFGHFHETVSDVEIDIDGLPMLECPACNLRVLPDRSRFCVMRAHEEATKAEEVIFKSKRNKIKEDFGLTDVPFDYDPDDFYYYPGLVRPWDNGFLTPVFFNRTVLTKYDADPRYLIEFASPTYGLIRFEDQFSFPFGINRHGHLIMWLGDIAKLPKAEQYYLLSENRPSDHSLGSEFYDAQIEAKFTAPTQENRLFAARSAFLNAAFKRWGEKIAHLETEVRDEAERLCRPVHDTVAQRRAASDTLNKVHLESLDNAKLAAILAAGKIDSPGTGTLKRLQALLTSIGDAEMVHGLMSPFYTLYDFRVACAHLGSAEASADKMKTVTGRLGLAENADLQTLYDALLAAMTTSYAALTKMLKGEESGGQKAQSG
jgi:hypothetical protein